MPSNKGARFLSWIATLENRNLSGLIHLRSAVPFASQPTMTSDNISFPQRFTKIDELTRGDHTYLAADDECLFLGDYSARKGFAHSATNSLILNFKKPLSRKGLPGWRYKGQAIREVADAYSRNLGTALSHLTLVPV